MMSPKIFKDTIMAFAGIVPEQVMVPLPQVQSITVQTLDKPRTIALAALGFATVVGVAGAISGHGPAPNPNCAGKQTNNQTISCRSRPALAIPATKLLGGIAHGIGLLGSD